jgi:hypothetical protein
MRSCETSRRQRGRISSFGPRPISPGRLSHAKCPTGCSGTGSNHARRRRCRGGQRNRARRISCAIWRLQRLSYARLFSRKARFVALSGWLRRGFDLPGLGTFVGPNLTPDNETGLGSWSKDEIVTAIQTGVRPDGRILAPIMPWRAFAGLTKADAGAIADYLKSLPPVSRKAQGPFGPGEKPPVPLMVVFPD